MFHISHDFRIAVVGSVRYSGQANAMLLVGYRWLRVQYERDGKEALGGVSLGGI